MSKGNTWEANILQLLFQAVATTNIADNAASGPLAALWISLHTADPGEAGTQLTSETAYQAYTRIGVSRNTAGWTVTTASGPVSPAANIDFPQCTSTPGTATVTHFAVGSTSSGTGVLYYSGTVTPVIVVANGVTPRLTTASAITED